MSKTLVPVCLFACTLFVGCGDGDSQSHPGQGFTKRDQVHTDKSPEEWLKILAGRNSLARDKAIDMMVEYGKDYVGDLVKILQESKSSDVRLAVCRTLSRIGKDAEEAVPELCKQLSDKTFKHRDGAAEALGKISAKMDQTLPALTAALKDEDTTVRCMAARSLGAIHSNDSKALSALMAAMEDEAMEVRAEAMYALGKVGPAAKDAIPALEEAAKSEYANIKFAAEDALSKIRGQ